jgi:RimJ/RimL family protein N-acetyltransferase
MTDAAFAAWRDRSTAEYAQSHVETGKWPADGALQMATRELAELLPGGRDTPGHAFWTILDEQGADVGTLWVGPAGSRANYLFIWDIWVEPERRGEGMGTAALQALEEFARSHDVQKIGLHVFGWNTGARRLYERLGFVETDVSMEKRL